MLIPSLPYSPRPLLERSEGFTGGWAYEGPGKG
jgi:hypothetical protein